MERPQVTISTPRGSTGFRHVDTCNRLAALAVPDGSYVGRAAQSKLTCHFCLRLRKRADATTIRNRKSSQTVTGIHMAEPRTSTWSRNGNLWSLHFSAQIANA